MILTRKCLKDFGLWHFENGNSFEYINFHNLSDNLKNALIIEFFDSVDIQINIITIQGGDYELFIRVDKFYIINIDNRLNTRQEATTEAIKKANEIYNET